MTSDWIDLTPLRASMDLGRQLGILSCLFCDQQRARQNCPWARKGHLRPPVHAIQFMQPGIIKGIPQPRRLAETNNRASRRPVVMPSKVLPAF